MSAAMWTKSKNIGNITMISHIIAKNKSVMFMIMFTFPTICIFKQYHRGSADVLQTSLAVMCPKLQRYHNRSVSYCFYTVQQFPIHHLLSIDYELIVYLTSLFFFANKYPSTSDKTNQPQLAMSVINRIECSFTLIHWTKGE